MGHGYIINSIDAGYLPADDLADIAPHQRLPAGDSDFRMHRLSSWPGGDRLEETRRTEIFLIIFVTETAIRIAVDAFQLQF